jgi:tetratricopeptide (TPR) repeat protein
MAPRPGVLDELHKLVDEGRYSGALEQLESLSKRTLAQPDVDVLRAQLYARVGKVTQAKELLAALATNRSLTILDQSTCELTRGLIEWEEGATARSVAAMQRAIKLAVDGGDLRRKCWSQIWLAKHVADLSGPTAATSIIRDCRQDAIKLGDARVWAGLHGTCAVIDARRGLVGTASTHVRMGLALLSRAPNAWLEATLEFTHTNIAILQSDYDSALFHGRRALDLAERCGVAACIRTSLSALGCVYYLLGDFDESTRCLRRALTIFNFDGDYRHAILDSLARIRLTQGSLDECASLLLEIENGISTKEERVLYGHRHSMLTRARLLARQGQHLEALRHLDDALTLAEEASDNLLHVCGRLEKAHVLQQANLIPEAIAEIREVMSRMPADSPDLYGHYELILACILGSQGLRESAITHRNRAETIFNGLGNHPGLRDLKHYWDTSTHSQTAKIFETVKLDLDTNAQVSTAIQSAACLTRHSNRPELVAIALVELFTASSAVERAVAKIDGRVVASLGVARSDEQLSRIYSQTVNNKVIEVSIAPKLDVESAATINAIMALLCSIEELKCARTEREERLTLWPTEELPQMNNDAVVNGNMRELMSTARKVAAANISVLLTGESGTGKEILARAIHTFSDRSDRAFVPFNCAAVPRDMLESQLFGHRRGAFTGADRDNPGVIRGARGGTLFLDEIGELSLELQRGFA